MNRPYPHGMDRIVFRGPAGFGDSVYDLAICVELLKQFKVISIRTRHPSLFAWMKGMETERWRKGGENLAIHYAHGRKVPGTCLWQDLLQSAQLDTKIPFEIKWKIHNQPLLDRIKKEAGDKKICIIACPYKPFDRPDNYGLDLRPDWNVFDKIVDYLKGKVFLVRIGKYVREHDTRGCHLDLVGKTSDTDLMDLGEVVDFGFSQNGFLIPLLESRNKPIFVLYSRKGLNSPDPIICNTKPEKILSKQTSGWAIDDHPMPDILSRLKETFHL